MNRIICLLLCTFSLFGDTFTDRLSEITEVSPQEWIKSGDRWTFRDEFEESRTEIVALLDQMGWFETKQATKMHYKYGVVLGALQPSVEKRINHLIEEWNRGVRFETIVFLTGNRPLHPEKEAAFSGTETDMMLATWESSPLPKDLRALPLVVIDAPPLPERGRPTTESTLYAWLEENPLPGSALFFSSQPYVQYQDAIIQAVLPQTFISETIGPEGGKTLPTSVLLDTVGKWNHWSR